MGQRRKAIPGDRLPNNINVRRIRDSEYTGERRVLELALARRIDKSRNGEINLDEDIQYADIAELINSQ
jgi:hypothetical protein